MYSNANFGEGDFPFVNTKLNLSHYTHVNGT